MRLAIVISACSVSSRERPTTGRCESDGHNDAAVHAIACGSFGRECDRNPPFGALTLYAARSQHDEVLAAKATAAAALAGQPNRTVVGQRMFGPLIALCGCCGCCGERCGEGCTLRTNVESLDLVPTHN
jgi:hypothetical protein